MIDKMSVARKLAAAHFDVEPGITRIFALREKPELEALPSNPVKLLEINESTAPSGVMPLLFGPAPASGIPFPSIIIEVTPGEFEQIKQNRLKLPEGWSLGEELSRPAGNGQGA